MLFNKTISIRTKIILAPILLIGMVSAFIYTYYPALQKKEAINTIEAKIKSIRDVFSIGVGVGMGATDMVAVSEVLNWAHNDSAIVYLSVLDKNNLEFASFNPQNLKLPKAILPSKVTNISVEQNKILFYKYNILYQDQVFGSLLIGYSLDSLYSKIAYLKRTTLYFCLSIFVLGVIISIIISNQITGNIRKLDSTVYLISQGDVTTRAQIKSNDEIGKLAKAFNSMIDNLNRSRDEMVKYSTQLEKQNEELNQFSYVVSHDLKTPLRAIFRLSEWIETDLGKENIPAEVQKNMETLRGRVFRLETLINGLLEYSRIGRVKLKSEEVNVKTLLKDVIDMINPPSRFKINVQEDMPVLHTKKILLHKVFYNLISNAIKYNDKKEGVINITVNPNGKYYQFAVEDNGMGIDPVYHKKIFTIFQTLETKDKVEAAGVGLAIIKKTIEDMGGKIQLDSEVGKGSKFSFTWLKNN